MGDIDRAFAAHLREVRVARGLTRSQLARLVGVSEAQIGRIESGARLPAFDTIVRIACELDVDLNRAKPLGARRKR